MPPRVQNQLVTNSLLPYLSSSSTSTSTISKIPTQCSSSSIPSTSRRTCRPFSSTVASQTRLRNEMFTWLNGEGAALKNYVPGSTNYLTQIKERDEQPTGRTRPFPLNQNFVSESILSEELRNEIYDRVVNQKKSVRAVSVDLGVDMRRVGAVVRLVELEKRQKQQGKSLALPYARAIHEMVPTTPLYEDTRDNRNRPHESINDLPVHKLTDPQIFYPVSESRQFNRVDAGRVFSAAPALENKQVTNDTADPAEAISRITQKPSNIEIVGKGEAEQQVLQPADARIPHPHLVAHERFRQSKPTEYREIFKAYNERLRQEETAEKERKRLAKERQEQQQMKVQPESSRFEFRFKDVVVSKETTGSDGRGSKAPGLRYGVPSYERKKGQVKIPTRVEV
ncbi:eukaryotic mitochondrial regulator protein-domain-containing protein [Aspergillus caelatus]|uniref:Eukaryotic mitochondrial regulator protein-domain-containing protein n=2 Tax=Aspergillus subgen. Circumdati TaxID=2720871 RepID=A0A5N7AGL7_9EURO|nr:eukaryotic mitochondrial regulator protein-domain-containing protein [Aspergillus caelatus]KAE8367770.1 eukaryotic mitochondrial regulator protein-domain-containing protein [Aspergillus caelatus]KAE8423216.1 eukaryotic mitochondrial regulator protein-domain-containing protein [Aspergillus pseudocaelatus]